MIRGLAIKALFDWDIFGIALFSNGFRVPSGTMLKPNKTRLRLVFFRCFNLGTPMGCRIWWIMEARYI